MVTGQTPVERLIVGRGAGHDVGMSRWLQSGTGPNITSYNLVAVRFKPSVRPTIPNGLRILRFSEASRFHATDIAGQ